MKEKMIKEPIKQVLMEWAEVSTSHGLPRVLRVKRLYLKIIWGLCFLGSLGFCIFLIYRSISDFLEYQVVTQIRLIPERPIIFPTVTICNLNPLVTKEANNFIFEKTSYWFGRNFTSFEELYAFSEENNLDLYGALEKIRQNAADPAFGDSKKLWTSNGKIYFLLQFQ